MKFIVTSQNTKLSYKKYYLQNFVTKINVTKDMYDRFIYQYHQSWYLYIDIFILNNYDDYLKQMLKTDLIGYLDKLDVLHYLADMSVECRNSLRLISPSHYLLWIYKNTISIDYIISNDIATIISSLKSCTDRNQLKYCILFLLKIDLQYITDVYSILKSHNLTFEDLICND